MPCPASCLWCADAGPDGATGSDGSHVTEKHYGCYKTGILFALAIILLLLIGCVPVFLLQANNNLILLILLATLVLIGLATFSYFRWQRNRALAMRRTYEQQKFTLTRLPKAADGPKPDPAPYAPYPRQNGSAKSAAPAPTKLDPAEDHDISGPQSRSTPINTPRYSFI